jgi:hypothetical protein
VQGTIWDVLIENDISRVKEVISGEQAHLIPLATQGVAHEKAFTGLCAKLGLKFERDVSKATNTPNPQV